MARRKGESNEEYNARMREYRAARRENDPEWAERQRVLGREYYHANSEYRAKRVEAARKRHQEKRNDPEYLAAMRERGRDRYWNHPISVLVREARSKPCVDCGRQHPFPAMDLDHVRGEKAFKVSVPAVCSRPVEEVQAEIDKCDVRCAICHRLRHSTLWEKAA